MKFRAKKSHMHRVGFFLTSLGRWSYARDGDIGKRKPLYTDKGSILSPEQRNPWHSRTRWSPLMPTPNHRTVSPLSSCRCEQTAHHSQLNCTNALSRQMSPAAIQCVADDSNAQPTKTLLYPKVWLSPPCAHQFHFSSLSSTQRAKTHFWTRWTLSPTHMSVHGRLEDDNFNNHTFGNSVSSGLARHPR